MQLCDATSETSEVFFIIMHGTIHLNADELDLPMAEKIRSAFAHQLITISPDSPADFEAKPGILARDLLNFFETLPQLSPEEAKAFNADIDAIRREANTSTFRDPWAS